MARRTKAEAPPDWPGLHYVGIDENGMGPRLGPLIVTSILARATDDAGKKLATTKPRGTIAKRIGDSKKLVAFDDSALGEAWARAIAAKSCTGPEATTPSELLAALAVDSEDVLQAPCPSHHVDLCWSTEGESFVSTDEVVRDCMRDLDRLRDRGLEIMRTRVAIICARRLNDAVQAGKSRFDVDLHTMERLALAARDDADAEIYAFCGKVGGFDFYSDRFGPLAGYLHTTLLEGRAWSEYQFPRIGRLAFVRDADDSHLVVGLSSLVGKWVRDHLMRRVVRYHRAHVPDLPDASGYHDPTTTRFVQASELVRKKQRIEAACFERTALWKKEAAEASEREAAALSEKEPKSRVRASPKVRAPQSARAASGK